MLALKGQRVAAKLQVAESIVPSPLLELERTVFRTAQDQGSILNFEILIVPILLRQLQDGALDDGRSLARYIEFFKDGVIGSVGISFDVVNTNRIFRNGRESSSRVLQNLDRLQAEGIPCTLILQESQAIGHRVGADRVRQFIHK